MTISATVEATDFIPLNNSPHFILIFFTRGDDGRLYNVEDIGTKTELYKIYNLPLLNFQTWDTNIFSGRRCVIRKEWWVKKLRLVFNEEKVSAQQRP